MRARLGVLGRPSLGRMSGKRGHDSSRAPFLTRLRIEPLEDRRLLSCLAPVSSGTSVSVPLSALPQPWLPAMVDGGVVLAAGQAVQCDAYSAPALADWNADGLADLIVGEKTADGDGKIRVYLNIGTAAAPEFGSWFHAQAADGDLAVPASGCLGVFPRLADLDGDGLTDLVTGLADGRIQFWPNVGTSAAPQFGTPGFVQAGPAGAKQDIQVGARATLDLVDWNHDGRNDLIVGGLDGRIRVFLDRATVGAADFHSGTTLQDAVGNDLIVPSGRASVAAVDLDVDGRTDLVVGNTEGQLLLARNTGTPTEPRFDTFEPIHAVGGGPVDLPGSARSRPVVADFNADGTADILLGAADGLVRVYRGEPIRSTADARAALHLYDEAGESVDVPFDSDTLIVAMGSWCPYSQSFARWLAGADVQTRLDGLRVVFAFQDESAMGGGPIYNRAILDNFAGEVTFLVPDSPAQPSGFPTYYDTQQGQFAETSVYTWIECWLAERGGAPVGGLVQQPLLPTTATSQQNPPANVVEVYWRADASDEAAGVADASETRTLSSTVAVSARFGDLPDNTMGLDPDGNFLSALHAVTSPDDLLAAGAVADRFLIAHASILGLANPVGELVPQEVFCDQLGMTHVVYRQLHQGVPVLGGELRVHLDADQRLSSVNGRVVSAIELDATPALSLDQALAVARWQYQTEFGAAVSPVVLRSAELNIVHTGLLDDSEEPVPRLVWAIQLVDENAWIDQTYYIDAQDGTLRLTLDNVRRLDRIVYDCSSKPPSLCSSNATLYYDNDWVDWTPPPDYYTFGCREGSGCPRGIENPRYPSEGSLDTDAVYEYFVDLHDYWWTTFQRNGANGQGGNTNGGVYSLSSDAGRTYLNWVSGNDPNCVSAVYWVDRGIGFCKGTVTPDVVGHEYAHGVKPTLIYSYQSGALNESRADVFGEMFELQVTNTIDWINGTDPIFGHRRRSLIDPPEYSYQPSSGPPVPHPDRFHSPDFYCGSEDNGGVHRNSTVPSKAFYLMAEGGTFNGYIIDGLGVETMEQILYRAITVYYTDSVTFNAAYSNIIQAATDLYGADDVAQVRKALRAVEMDHPGKCSAPAPASELIDRHVFYNNSIFDGDDPAANAADDAAMAPGKQALLPGQTATAANLTSYSRGINGVMIDVAHLVNHVTSPDGLTAADFEFRAGTTGDPAAWSEAPTPETIHFDGKAGRVTITWADGAIADGWLQVVLKASTSIGLAQDVVFNYGNLRGDVDGNFVVTTADVDAVLAAVDPGQPVGVDNPFDVNRDGTVDATDVALVEAAVGNRLVRLDLVPHLLPGDANDNGTVDAEDAKILAANWGKSGMIWAEGDFNRDGVVNAIDASILAANWGATLPAAEELPNEPVQPVEPIVADDSPFIGPLPAGHSSVSRRLIEPTGRGERAASLLTGPMAGRLSSGEAALARDAAGRLSSTVERRLGLLSVVGFASSNEHPLFGPRIGTHGAGGAVLAKAGDQDGDFVDELGDELQPPTSGTATWWPASIWFDGASASEFGSEDDAGEYAGLAPAELFDAALGQIADEPPPPETRPTPAAEHLSAKSH